MGDRKLCPLRLGRKDYRPYEVTWKGKTIQVDMGRMLRKGIHFDSPLPKFGNLSMNQLAFQKKAKMLQVPPTGIFSYLGCCRATNTPAGGGALKHRATAREGAGVAVQSGYGDGTYPVYAFYNDEDRIIRIEVCFD